MYGLLERHVTHRTRFVAAWVWLKFQEAREAIFMSSVCCKLASMRLGWPPLVCRSYQFSWKSENYLVRKMKGAGTDRHRHKKKSGIQIRALKIILCYIGRNLCMFAKLTRKPLCLQNTLYMLRSFKWHWCQRSSKQHMPYRPCVWIATLARIYIFCTIDRLRFEPRLLISPGI
jgi:hypothetical protein